MKVFITLFIISIVDYSNWFYEIIKMNTRFIIVYFIHYSSKSLDDNSPNKMFVFSFQPAQLLLQNGEQSFGVEWTKPITSNEAGIIIHKTFRTNSYWIFVTAFSLRHHPHLHHFFAIFWFCDFFFELALAGGKNRVGTQIID